MTFRTSLLLVVSMGGMLLSAAPDSFAADPYYDGKTLEQWVQAWRKANCSMPTVVGELVEADFKNQANGKLLAGALAQMLNGPTRDKALWSLEVAAIKAKRDESNWSQVKHIYASVVPQLVRAVEQKEPHLHALAALREIDPEAAARAVPAR